MHSIPGADNERILEEEANVKANEAFEVLINELRTALENAQAKGTQAFQSSQYAEAQSAARQAEEISRQLESIESLRSAWDGLIAGDGTRRKQTKSTRRKRTLLPKGEKFSSNAFKKPVLEALVELGGSGGQKEVLRVVEENVGEQFKPVDFEILNDGHSVRWKNAAAWARFELVKEGLMKSDSPRGVWEISEAGREYLQGQTG